MPLTDGMAITLLGTLWIGLAIAHAILLRELAARRRDRDRRARRHVHRRHGRLPRRALVRHAAAGAAVSPNKTVEGLVFGVVAGALAVWCAGLCQDWLGGWEALLLGVAVGVAAPLGDLFESKIKRDAGTKDAGTLFGAHGGALDRLDAALFSLVAGYYVWLVLL